MPDRRNAHVRVASAGSGFGGLGAAIRLLQDGEDDFVVFERAKNVGGVWRDNTYPGCGCDVESHLYSFSFARNPEWTRRYSPWSEIQRYLRDCAERFGVLPHTRFGHEVKRVTWHGEVHWMDRRDVAGDLTADVFVAATGALSEPSTPRLRGLESFRGNAFHSARWDHGNDLRGEEGRRHRHGRVGDPDRPVDPAGGGEALALPAHAALGNPASRQGDLGVGAQAPPRAPVAPVARPCRDLRATRALRVHVLRRPDRPRARAARAPPSGAERPRPRAPRQAHPELPARLQAHPHE